MDINSILPIDLINQIDSVSPDLDWKQEFLTIIFVLNPRLKTEKFITQFAKWLALGYPIEFVNHFELYNYEASTYTKYLDYHLQSRGITCKNLNYISKSDCSIMTRLLIGRLPLELYDDLMKHNISFNTYFESCSMVSSLTYSVVTNNSYLAILDNLKIFNNLGLSYLENLKEALRQLLSDKNNYYKNYKNFVRNIYFHYFKRFYPNIYNSLMSHGITKDILLSDISLEAFRKLFSALELIECENLALQNTNIQSLVELYINNYNNKDNTLPLNYLMCHNIDPLVYSNLGLSNEELLDLVHDTTPYQPPLFSPQLELWSIQ